VPTVQTQAEMEEVKNDSTVPTRGDRTQRDAALAEFQLLACSHLLGNLHLRFWILQGVWFVRKIAMLLWLARCDKDSWLVLWMGDATHCRKGGGHKRGGGGGGGTDMGRVATVCPRKKACHLPW